MTRLGLVVALALLLAALAPLAGSVIGDTEDTVGGVSVGLDGRRLLVDLRGNVTPVGGYPPDADRIVVAPDGRWRAVLNVGGNTRVVAIGRRSAGAPTRIVERRRFVSDASLAWSPNSRWLALTTWVPHQLSAVAVSTDGRRRVLAAPFCGDAQNGLAWAPRGDRVALAAPAPGTGCQRGVNLRVRAVEGGRGSVIARGITGSPTWSPDGRWIATASEVMRADGSQRQSLTGEFASWWTRGHRLAVISGQDRALDVGWFGSMRAWDRGVRETPPPRFSPNGSLVAYVRSDGIVIRRVVDRRVVARVPTAGLVMLDDLAWRADGRSLLVRARSFTQG